MVASSKHRKAKRFRQAIQKIVGEFLLVFAVLLLLTQTFTAQAAFDLDVICGEQGVVLVQSETINTQDSNGQPCPECASCADCLTGATRTSLLSQPLDFVSADIAPFVPNECRAHRPMSSALIRTPMLRGPPSAKDRSNMYNDASTRARHMGDFS